MCRRRYCRCEGLGEDGGGGEGGEGQTVVPKKWCAVRELQCLEGREDEVVFVSERRGQAPAGGARVVIVGCMLLNALQ